MMGFLSRKVTSHDNVADSRKSRCSFISTRRWPTPVAETASGLVPEATDAILEGRNQSDVPTTHGVPLLEPEVPSLPECTYSRTWLLQTRRTVKPTQSSSSTLPIRMRGVAELPSDFQAPDWQQRHPVKPKIDEDQHSIDAAKMLRAARSILNKLTVEKFETLFEQLVTCGIDRPDHISLLMREIFDKATKQHPFIPMYADLCRRLEKDPRIVAVAESAGHQHDFRRLLLNQCQIAFENLLTPCAETQEQHEETNLCRKQEALGNIKLIGHLLVKHMLTSEMLVECADELLAKRDSCPEALESLAALLMVAAPTLDTPTWQHYSRLEGVFAAIRKVAKSKSTQPRVRFILRDVLDVRDAGWPNSNKSEARMQMTQCDTGFGAAGSATADPVDVKVADARICNLECQEAQEVNDKACFDDTSGSLDQLDVSLFDVVAFRRILAAVLSDLIANQDVAAAVNRIRLQQVPVGCQSDQVVDLLTRILEEKRGPHRRRAIAFLTGLVASEQSPFEQRAFLKGISLFFRDVYNELCHEVPRLTSMISTELVPVLLTVYPKSQIVALLPAGFYCPALR